MPLGIAGAVLTGVVLATSASAASEPPSFEYDRGRPLEVQPTGVTLRDISFVGASGRRIEATVIGPSAAGRHPAVLFAHWYEGPAQSSNRTEFVPDALRLARFGVVSFLVDTPWSSPDWFMTRDPGRDFASSVEQVEDLRRAVDVVAGLDEVDASRIAYVGHDFGAMYGAIVAGVDHRVKGFVFMAGTRSFADWFLLGRKLEPEAERSVREELTPLDPIAYVPRIAPAPVLFQFATKDPYVNKETADSLVAAAGEPKSVKFYDCGHSMNMEALEDRIPWLLRALGMPPQGR
jgi:cephalosporin-C deacetylase-like acetyl esterase